MHAVWFFAVLVFNFMNSEGASNRRMNALIDRHRKDIRIFLEERLAEIKLEF